MNRTLQLVGVMLLLLGMLLQPAALLAAVPAQEPPPVTEPAAGELAPAWAADSTGAEPFAIAAVNSVVGDGTPASCDGNAFEAAVTAGGVVTFNCGAAPHTIIVNTNVVANNVEIDGGNLITLHGDSLRQIFLVQAGGTLKLRYITLSEGNFFNGGAIDNAGTTELRRVNINNSRVEGGSGGAIYNRGGTLLVEESRLQANYAGTDGGAIFSEGGSVTVARSLLDANYAAGDGGAIALAGGTLVIENSTISSNSAGSDGGALNAPLAPGAGSVTILHATFYLNAAESGGTINTYRDNPAQPINISNSALYVSAGNQFVCSLNSTDDIVSGGYNWANDDSCGLSGANDFQGNEDPLLGELADNSGPTQTHLPAAGSPLIDKIPVELCPAIDQRLLPRPQNPTCDIGAVESAPTTVNVPLNQPNVQPFRLGRILVRPIAWPIFLSDPNVAAQRLEVTQAIQEQDGTGVVMIANKATYVRFHVYNASFSADPVVGARLWRIVNGVRVGDPIVPSTRLGVIRLVPYLRFSPTATAASWTFDPYITVRRSPDRNALNDSFYFRLPAAWTTAGSLTVEAEVNPTFLSTVLAESDRSDNTARATVTFENTPSMVVRLFAVRTRINNVVQAPTETQLRELESWLRRAYPIHRLRIIRDVEDMTNLNRLPTCDEVNGRLFWDNLFLKWAGVDERDTRYYGLVSDGPSGANFMRGCADDIPSFIASGPTGDPSTQGFASWDTNNDGVSYGDWYGGHEIAHTWGRFHTLCRGDEVGSQPINQDGGTIGRRNNANSHWGFDVALKGPVVYPPTWTDIMSYCSNQWISAASYTGIRDRLVSENAAMVAAQAMEPAGGPPPIDSLVVQGRVKTDTPGAVIDVAYRLTAPDVIDSTPGPWSIRLVGAGGAVLASYPFTPRTDTDDPDGVVTLPRFAEQVPWVAGTQLIQIVHETDGLLTQRAVSPSAPSATVTAPAAGVVVTNAGVTISWTASDPDGGTLLSTVLFSRDGGATFSPLRLHLPTQVAPAVNTIVVSLGELAQTTQGIVRVVVSDGVNTGQDDSDPYFSVPNLTPAVVILGPANGASYPYGVAVELIGSAVDPETPELPDAAYAWSSSIDGPLGTGQELLAELLSPGTHTVGLRVTDSMGGQGIAERTIVIADDAMVAAAALSVAPASTTFFADFGSSTVQTQDLSLRNNTGGEVDWTTTSSAPWLTVSVAGGQTPSEALLQLNPAGLAVGLHKATLTISGSGPAGAVPQQKVQVFVHVDGEQVMLPLVRNQ